MDVPQGRKLLGWGGGVPGEGGGRAYIFTEIEILLNSGNSRLILG